MRLHSYACVTRAQGNDKSILQPTEVGFVFSKAAILIDGLCRFNRRQFSDMMNRENFRIHGEL